MADPCIKAVFIGDSGVGKTALIDRVVSKDYSRDFTPTIGVTFVRHAVYHEGSIVQFQIWDTAGADTYRTLVPIYMRNARLVFVVFDLTDRESFDNVLEWMATLRQVCDDSEVALVGNKCDLTGDRQISIGEGESMRRGINAEFYLETSALTGEGTEELFARFLEKAPRKPALARQPDLEQQRATVEIADRADSESNWCCS
jgi:small GTP-binding protein